MRQNSKNRFNARHNNRGHRPQMIFRNTALDSTGPGGKLHGTALQLFEKYQAAAKDAQIQNDAILAETFLQYADHYMRLQNQAILNEENMRTQNAPRRPETKADTQPQPNDVAQESETTQNEHIQPSETPEQMSDNVLKEMDLSVPVLAIQEKNAEQKQPQKSKGRRTQSKKAESQA